MKDSRSGGIYDRVVKRFLDIVCSFAAFVLFFWLYGILAVMVRVKLGKPVIYSTERAGRIDPETGKEKIFRLYKFRSMSDARDENGELLPDTDRLTSFGRKLRASSLDELPELWNIFRGQMSIVGPRPLPPEYLPYYRPEERLRHTVRPGLTGLAQVSGRNAISWDEKFRYDVEYVKNLSFVRDVKIIFRTVSKVFRREGIGQGEEHPGNLYDIRADMKKD